MRDNDRRVVFSSARKDWETPPALIEALRAETRFDLDAAANEQNTLCGENFLGPGSPLAKDALSVGWCEYAGPFGIVWCNPPYGRSIGDWTAKFVTESSLVTVYALLPVRPDTIWWQRDVMEQADEVRLIPHRVRFRIGGRALAGAPFPSAVIIWRPGIYRARPRFLTWDYEERRNGRRKR